MVSSKNEMSHLRSRVVRQESWAQPYHEGGDMTQGPLDREDSSPLL